MIKGSELRMKFWILHPSCSPPGRGGSAEGEEVLGETLEE